MSSLKSLYFIPSLLAITAGAASAATTCTLVVDAATSATLIRTGDRCEAPVTPASTFKIPLSLVGFDSGILTDATHPAWPYKAVVPATCVLLMLQGVSETIKSVYAWRTGVVLEEKEKVEI